MARILEDEIVGDPLGRGYSGMTDAALLTSLNAVNRTRNRTTMTGREVAGEVVDSEYDALTDAKKEQFLSLTASETLDPFGLGANVVKDVFGGASTTVSNLATARVENISRGQEIGFGEVTIKSLRLHTITRSQG